VFVPVLVHATELRGGKLGPQKVGTPCVRVVRTEHIGGPFTHVQRGQLGRERVDAGEATVDACEVALLGAHPILPNINAIRKPTLVAPAVAPDGAAAGRGRWR